MIIFLDDEREFHMIHSVFFREKMNLPSFTDEQKNIIVKNRRQALHCKTVEEVQEYINTNGLPEMICFDNDLGPGNKEGRELLNWIVRNDLGYFNAYFHTANRVARDYMQQLYDSYIVNHVISKEDNDE